MSRIRIALLAAALALASVSMSAMPANAYPTQTCSGTWDSEEVSDGSGWWKCTWSTYFGNWRWVMVDCLGRDYRPPPP